MTQSQLAQQLYELLDASLQDGDLRDVCLYLNQDYDDLGSGGRRDRLRQLIITMDKRRALGSLRHAVIRRRDDLEKALERLGSDASSDLSYLDIARTNLLPPPGPQHVLRNPERIYVPVRLAPTPDVVGEDGLTYLDRRLKQAGVVLAVGGYGTGKSFLAQKLFLEAASAYRSSQGGPKRLPILFPLKRLVGRAPDLVMLRLVEYLQTLGFFPREDDGTKLRAEFEGRLREGDFLCVLDGFDEIPLLAMRQNPAGELRSLLDSLVVGANQVVVTSRPAILTGAMFSALAAERGIDLAYLQPWTSDDHFRRYLVECARCGVDFGPHLTEFEHWVLSRPELRALTSTPLYCQMLVETRDQIVRRTDLNIATLYTLYTERYFVNVSERSLLHQRISDVQKEVVYRSDCLAATATGMLREGNLRLSVQQIELALRHYAQKYDDELLSVFTKLDTLIYSLLIPDAANGYSFSHKSFFEYYVARKVVQQLEDANETEHVIAQVLLAKEIVAFLAGLLTVRHPFAVSLGTAFGTAAPVGEIKKSVPQFARYSGGETLLRNLAALQLELGGDVSAAALDGLDFNGFQFGSREFPAVLNGVKLNGAKLEGATFVGADLRGGHFRAAKLNRCSLDDANLRDADLTGAFLHDISCNLARFVGARFRGVSLGARDAHRILAAVHTEVATDPSEQSRQWLGATEKTLTACAI